MGHRRALCGPIILSWGFLDGYLRLMAFEVVLERGKRFSKEKQRENAIPDTTEGLESNGSVSGESIHWNVAGARGSLEVEGNEFGKPEDLELQAEQFEFHVVGNEDGME